jgi:hypothetical protein
MRINHRVVDSVIAELQELSKDAKEHGLDMVAGEAESIVKKLDNDNSLDHADKVFLMNHNIPEIVIFEKDETDW